MADHDQSISNLRYNQTTQGIEGFGGGSPQWTPLIIATGTEAAFTPTVYFITTSQTTTSSTAFVPSSTLANFAIATAGHRVKITVSGDTRYSSVSGGTAFYTVFVDGTDIGPLDNLGFTDFSPVSGGSPVSPLSFTVVYTPADVSPHAYVVNFKTDTGADTVDCPLNTGIIVLEEII